MTTPATAVAVVVAGEAAAEVIISMLFSSRSNITSIASVSLGNVGSERYVHIYTSVSQLGLDIFRSRASHSRKYLPGQLIRIRLKIDETMLLLDGHFCSRKISAFPPLFFCFVLFFVSLLFCFQAPSACEMW